MMRHPTVVLHGSSSPKPVSYFVQRNQAYGRWVAKLLHGQFAGNFDPYTTYEKPIYYIPARTLVMSLEEARTLGISGQEDLMGGIVPAGYVGTKAITHGLIADEAHRPDEWSQAFTDAVKHIVLPGFSVFSKEDALQAGMRLLEDGDVRFKPASGRSGRDQAVIASREDLVHHVSRMDSQELQIYGLVLERNLHDINTLSVGTLLLDRHYISYYGTQRMTLNNQGTVEYEGSDLFFIRGALEHLLQLDVADNIRLAMEQAITYDAASSHYPGVIASRRNYDVGQGHDRDGNFLSGVLEQSWRIGGATGAELCAFECFQNDPGITAVESSTYCVFGWDKQLPPQAIVQFDDADTGYGPMKVYTVLGKTHHGILSALSLDSMEGRA
jgi:hypothetical protein